MNSQDNQNHPGSQPVIPFTGLQAIRAAEQMKRQAEGKPLEGGSWMADSRPLLAEIAILAAQRDEAKLTASKILCEWGAIQIERDALVKALKMAQRVMKKTIGESAKDISETCLSAEAHAMTVDGLEAVAAALSQVKGGA